jgi:hypothetical protein
MSQRGNLLTFTQENDYGADGVIDRRTQTVNTYDEVGNLLSSVVESDDSADGVIDYRKETVYEYLNPKQFAIDATSPIQSLPFDAAEQAATLAVSYNPFSQSGLSLIF